MSDSRLGALPDLLQTGADRLQAELLAEKAAALGRSGERVEKALAAHRAAVEADDPARIALAYEAAEAVQAYFIQRELSGHRSHDDVARRLAIPREVLGKVGASRR